MSELKVMNQQLEKARSAKEVFSIDFVADRSIKNYEAVTGRKDGNNWYQGEVLAMIKLFFSDRISGPLCHSSWYHLQVKPSQTMFSREVLNEYTTSTTMGA